MPQLITPYVLTGLASVGISGPIATAIASGVVQIGFGVLLSSASNLLRGDRGRPDVAEVRQELQVPQELPKQRFVYGDTEMPGSPAPANVTEGAFLYGVWILNSRPSAGPLTIYLDEREVTLDPADDPYDFGVGGGAAATGDPFGGYLRVWIGLGDQTGPPADILSAVPFVASTAEERFKSTDGWQGRTVVWLKINRGPNESRPERWPAMPPQVTARGKAALVWDPRDTAQDADDPSTWSWSDNHALITLDALRQNPVQAWPREALMLDTFSWAADVADETVALKSGGTEPRYRAAGVLTFSDSEIEDQLAPLFAAGAADPIRSGGRLGILPGTWQAPVVTLADLLSPGYEFRTLKPGRDLYQRVRAFYRSAARDYEAAELGTWDIPGAEGDGGVPKALDLRLDFVESATQAMRVRKIRGYEARRQRMLSGVAPPAFVEALPGARVTVATGRARLDGTYRLVSARPGLDLLGADGGVALRVAFELVEDDAAAFEWDPDTEEEDVIVPPFDPDFAGIASPGALSVTTGAAVDLDTGGAIVPRIRFEADPSASETVTGYEWQYQVHSGANDGPWTAGGTIDGEVRDGDGDVFGYLIAEGVGVFHDIRMRAVAGSAASAWVVIEDVVIDLAVTINTSSGGAARADFNVTAPDSALLVGVRIYEGAVGAGFAAASDVSGLVAIDAGATDDIAATGLSPGAFDYWVAAEATDGTIAAPAGPETLTIT